MTTQATPQVTPEELQELNDAAKALFESMQRTDAASAKYTAIAAKAVKKAQVKAK